LHHAARSFCPVEIEHAGYCGTVVVLHGVRADHDTVQPPEGLGVDWLMQTINGRFLRLPHDIAVCCQRPGETDRRRARGHLAHLSPHVVDQGVVTLTDADVHWMLLDDQHDKRRKNGGRYVAIGHRAAIHNNELYDTKTISAGGFRALQAFGIHSGYQRVALLVEPMGASTDQTRGRLLLDEDKIDKDLSWDRWAEEFIAAMPQALRDLVADSAGTAARRDRRELMRRLQELDAAMPMPAYIADDDGTDESADPTHGHTATVTKNRSGRSGGTAGSKHGGSIVSLFTRPNGPPATREKGPIPEIKPEWISRARGQRPDGVLDDLAATYLTRAGVVQINEDFRGYMVLRDYFLARHAGQHGAHELVEQEVKAACEDQAVEFIVGVLRVRCEPHWDTGRVEKAVSDEALTGCLMQHASLAARISDRLNRRLTKQAAAA